MADFVEIAIRAIKFWENKNFLRKGEGGATVKWRPPSVVTGSSNNIFSYVSFFLLLPEMGYEFKI